MNIRQFVKYLETIDGGTFDVQWDNRGNLDIIPMELVSGYMVSAPHSGFIYDPYRDRGILMEALWDWAEREKLSLETFYLGVWEDSGVVYFDVSVCVTTRELALKLGAEYNQLAIWDNSAKVAITI